MKHSKENIIILLQSILTSLDKSYDTLSQSSLEYIYSNLKIIDTMLSSDNSKNKINKEDDCDLNDLSESQLILKLNYKSQNETNNYNIDDLDDLID
jgi:hypothetical protein